MGARAPVLVGVDGSPHCLPAIELAVTEANTRDGPLVAVHMYWARAVDSLRHPDADLEPAARWTAGTRLTTAVGPHTAK